MESVETNYVFLRNGAKAYYKKYDFKDLVKNNKKVICIGKQANSNTELNYSWYSYPHSFNNGLFGARNELLGLLHNEYGPAITKAPNGKDSYYLDGVFYFSREEWFASLSTEQKYNVIWKL